MTYTPRTDGIQIADVTYIGKPPKDTPPRYDVVKWEKSEPFESIDIRTGKREIHTEYCYTLGQLEWDAREGCFDFKSIGTRWLEAKPSDRVVDMILTFCREKGKELEKDEAD